MKRVNLSITSITGSFWAMVWLIIWGAVEPQPVRAAEQAQGITKAISTIMVHVDSDLAYGAEPLRVIVVDKARQQIRVYSHENKWRTIAKWPCSTGKQSGPKEREGDQRTPVGVYFAVRDVGQKFLNDTYGTRALPLDYPNELDRRNHRSGSAIWLHGTDRPLLPRDSNGCVVMENHVIDRLAPYIHLNRTPVIIVERVRLWAEKKARALADHLLLKADQWNSAMMHGSYQKFCRHYADEAKPSSRWWQRWVRHRQQQMQGVRVESLMRRRTIYRSGHHFVLLFDHHLRWDGHEQWAGYRKLYLSVEKDRVSIVADAFQASPKTGGDPLFHAWRKLWQKREQRSRIAVTLNGDKNS